MLGAVSEPSPPDRDRPHADFYAAAVYGSIVAAALVAAFHEEHASPETTLLSLLSTMAVFWLAHVWSAIVGERIHVGDEFANHRIGAIARAEWPLVESAFLPAVALLLGFAGAIGAAHSLDAALVACVLQLFGWGLVVGRRAYDHWWAALFSGLTNGVLGIVLVSLEIAVVLSSHEAGVRSRKRPAWTA